MAGICTKNRSRNGIINRFGFVINARKTHAIHKYAEAINKYMKDYDLNTESSLVMYLDVNNRYGRAMSQKIPVDGFKWRKKRSKLTQKFIQNYNNDSDKEIYSKTVPKSKTNRS